MEAVFQTVLQMSAKASVVILAVLLVRLFLKKAPRKYSYLLWAVVGFRLLCPVSVASVVSIFNMFQHTEVTAVPTVEQTIEHWAAAPPAVHAPVVSATAPSTALPAQTPAAVNWFQIAALVWCVGMAVLLLYAVVSCLQLRRRLSTAVRLEGNVYQSETVASPFILGVLRPRIYLPYGLDGQALDYVLAHERTHLRNGDHLVKPAAFALLAVHWFNPLCWLAFALMSRDMEMRCDEAVLARKGYSPKAYSVTLLSFAVRGRFPAPVPLAFGETGVKSRIKNALKWKRPKIWVTALAVMVCVASLVACGTGAKETRSEEPLSITDAVHALFNSAEWDGDTFRFTIPAGYETPEDWTIQLKNERGAGVHPVNQEQRTVWEAGKTYEVDGSDILYIKLVVWMPGPDGKQVRYESFQDRELPFSTTGYGIKRDFDLMELEVYAVCLNDTREQVLSAWGREPDEETLDEYTNNVLTYSRDNATVTYYLWDGTVDSIKAESPDCDWFGETVDTDGIFARFGDPDGASYSRDAASVGYTRHTEPALGIGATMWLNFNISDSAYQLDGTLRLSRTVNSVYRPSTVIYSENIYTKDWWVGVDPEDYGITAEELASNPLPDFASMSLEALGAYYVNSDGAGAEGASYELYRRFQADPIAVLDYLSSLGWTQDSAGHPAVNTIAYALVMDGYYASEGKLPEILDTCKTQTLTSRETDLISYLEREFETYSRWAVLQH